MRKLLVLPLFFLANHVLSQDSNKTQDIAIESNNECVIPALNPPYGSRISSTSSSNNKSNYKIGKSHNKGSVIYYAEYQDANKFFQFKEDFKITNKSPFNRNYNIKNGDKFISKAAFLENKTKKHYDIISPDNIVWFLVDENGVLCSGGYASGNNWELNNLIPYVVPKHNPPDILMEQTKEQEQAATKKAIAIKLDSFDELMLTLEVASIINDKITKTKKISLSSLKGDIDVGGINILFHINEGQLILDGVVDATNFSLVESKLFSR